MGKVSTVVSHLTGDSLNWRKPQLSGDHVSHLTGDFGGEATKIGFSHLSGDIGGEATKIGIQYT